jgi:hypothetical protein
MGVYTYTELYGSGSIGEDLTGQSFNFSNPSGSSYFTMETIPASTGFYEASSPKNFIGSFENFIHPLGSNKPILYESLGTSYFLHI